MGSEMCIRDRYIQGEQQNEWDDELRHDSQDDMVCHAHFPLSSGVRTCSGVPKPEQKDDAEPGREDHHKLAQRVLAPVARQHSGDHVRDPGFHFSEVDVAGGHVGIGGRRRVAERWQVEGAVSQQPGDGDCHQQRNPLRPRQAFLALYGKPHGGQQEHSRDPGANGGFGERNVHCVQQEEDRGHQEAEEAGEHDRGDKAVPHNNGPGDNPEKREQRDVDQETDGGFSSEADGCTQGRTPSS